MYMRRMKDIHDITATTARYLIRRIFVAYGHRKPADREIILDGCYVTEYPYEGGSKWVRVSIIADIKGKLYRFGVDLAQCPCRNSTMYCNMFMSE